MTSLGIFSFGHTTGTLFFGQLASFAAVVALLADLVVSPALVVLAVGR